MTASLPMSQRFPGGRPIRSGNEPDHTETSPVANRLRTSCCAGSVRAVKSSGDDDRPARARYNLLLGGILLVVGVVLLAGRRDLVAGAIFTFVGAVMLLGGWLFSWSRNDRSRK
jgi:hypothetical protein